MSSHRLRSFVRWAHGLATKVPPVLRSLLGLALIGFGVLGFLPILGFWMAPVGLVFIALDIPLARRWVEKRFAIGRE
jgi:hypothetical protein